MPAHELSHGHASSISFLLLPSQKLQLQDLKISFNSHHYQLRKNFIICACSAKNSRRGKKVKSGAELSNDIREFLSAVGLPEGHVPTMKELSAHGRTDLAHIVRRRGYKFIRDLLSNSIEEESNGFSMQKQLAQGQDTTSYYAEGQDEKVEDVIDSEIQVIQDSSASGIISDHGYMLIESPISGSQDAEWQTAEAKTVVQQEIEDSLMPTSIGKVDQHLEGQDEKVGDIIEDSEIPVIQDSSTSAGVIPEYNYTDHGYMLTESPGRVNHHVRDDDLPAESLASSDIRKNMDDEARDREIKVEINHLKFLLHQKEFELSYLKEQIEKEKISLSDLQMKTEEEIFKAQKLVSEKDAEMYAAGESLSGLIEVNIQYNGEGEIVEVAGSFNGWHHPIKMDPQPYSSNADRTGSRKVRLWSTLLWLYPGVYEIKFIVDGYWTLDPERESVTKDGICNNILRVV